MNRILHCSKCGPVELDSSGMAAQLAVPSEPWKCPRCGLAGAIIEPRGTQHQAYANKLGFSVSSDEALALLALSLHEFPMNTTRSPDGPVIVTCAADRSVWVCDMLVARGFLIKGVTEVGSFYEWTQKMKDLDARFKR